MTAYQASVDRRVRYQKGKRQGEAYHPARRRATQMHLRPTVCGCKNVTSFEGYNNDGDLVVGQSGRRPVVVSHHQRTIRVRRSRSYA